MADYNWTLIIIATAIGFFALAFILLYPIYRFMRREEDVSKGWTREAMARRQQREQPSGDGAPGHPPERPRKEEPSGS